MNALASHIQKDSSGDVPEQLEKLVDAIKDKAQNIDGIAGIILYGSGLWKGDQASEDTVWDLHVLVDRYRDFDPSLFLAIMGSVLPHNVYYMEAQSDQILRCKYNVMRWDQFLSHARGKSFTPQIWARFCQPCRIVYAKNEDYQSDLYQALASCTHTFLRRSLPLFGTKTIKWDQVWEGGFQQTYKDELRSERKQRGQTIVEASPDHFKERLSLALQGGQYQAEFIDEETVALGYSEMQTHLSRLGRLMLRPFRKLVTLFRLIKALLTFTNALDYAVWKIERHSGYKIELTEFQRKYPLIGGWPVLFSLMRAGALK